MTIERNREEILRIAARHGARNVRVFGSVARGDDRFDSDVDLLVEMQDDRSLLDLVGLEQDLEELLQRKVGVLTDASIHPAFVSGLLPKHEPCEGRARLSRAHSPVRVTERHCKPWLKTLQRKLEEEVRRPGTNE